MSRVYAAGGLSYPRARRAHRGIPPESEKQFQASTVRLARLLGWLVQYTTDSRKSPSGWPDLFMVRGNRAVAMELKAADGVVEPDQQVWHDRLSATCVETYIFRPADKQKVFEVLK